MPFLSKYGENSILRSFFYFDLIEFYFLSDFEVFWKKILRMFARFVFLLKCAK